MSGYAINSSQPATLPSFHITQGDIVVLDKNFTQETAIDKNKIFHATAFYLPHTAGNLIIEIIDGSIIPIIDWPAGKFLFVRAAKRILSFYNFTSALGLVDSTSDMILWYADGDITVS